MVCLVLSLLIHIFIYRNICLISDNNLISEFLQEFCYRLDLVIKILHFCDKIRELFCLKVYKDITEIYLCYKWFIPKSIGFRGQNHV